jgi:hypothetical protein
MAEVGEWMGLARSAASPAGFGTSRANEPLGITTDAEDYPILVWYHNDLEARASDELVIVKFAP